VGRNEPYPQLFRACTGLATGTYCNGHCTNLIKRWTDLQNPPTCRHSNAKCILQNATISITRTICKAHIVTQFISWCHCVTPSCGEPQPVAFFILVGFYGSYKKFCGFQAKVLPNVEVCSVGETTRFVPSANSSSDCSAADTDIWSLLANSSVADYSRIEPEIKRLLNDRGFVKTEENEKQPEFQALSLELINNWKCEWWRQVVHNSGTEIRIEREDPGWVFWCS